MMTEPTYLGNPNLKKQMYNKSGLRKNFLSTKDVWMITLFHTDLCKNCFS